MKTTKIPKLAEIPSPYTDWEKMRHMYDFIEDPRYAIDALYLTVTRSENKIPKECGCQAISLDDLGLIDFTTARRYAAIELTSIVNAYYSRERKNLKKEVGLDNTLISKMTVSIATALELEEIRPFSSPTETIYPISEQVLNTTSHELLFGTPGRIVLPSAYAWVATVLLRLGSNDWKNLLNEGHELYNKEISDYKKYCNELKLVDLSLFHQTRPMDVVILERMADLGEDNTINEFRYIGIMSRLSKIPLRAVYRKLLDNEGLPPFSPKAYTPNLETLMFFSLVSGQAIDFFLANDFVTPMRDNIYLKDADGKLRKIEDESVLEILGLCAALPKEKKSKYMASILSHSV